MNRRIVANEVLFAEVETLIAGGGNVLLRTKGTSMLPFIEGGRDSVLLAAPDKLGTGDIVLARIKGTLYVVHRIYRIESDIIVLMGDGNTGLQEKCKRSDILAKVIRITDGKRETDCTARWHYLKAWIWRNMLPFRRYLLGICKMFRK